MRRPVLLLGAMLSALVACNTPVGIKPVGEGKTLQLSTSSVFQDGTLSRYSIETLASYGLQERYRTDPDQVLVELFERSRLDRNPSGILAMAELCARVARRRASQPHYLASAFFAYVYLFHPAMRGGRNPFDPRFRIACDLYNRSLTEAFRDADGTFRFKGGSRRLPFGRMLVRVERPGFPWGEAAFGRFLPADDFHVRGLWNRHRAAGLGVPLIAVRTSQTTDDMMGREAKVPATAFLRIDLSRERTMAGDLVATLELYASMNALEVEVEGEAVPLEADFTATLAYGLNDGRLFGFELRGLLAGDDPRHPLGLFQVHPYQPGKIPVVFVHGTASSPARWAQMFNALQSDRFLRENCQFLFFVYTTGNPVLYSGHLLREALDTYVRRMDAGGGDPMLRQMVLIGHSQGGLLTRLQVTDSGDRIWNGLSDRPLDQLGLAPAEEELLQAVMFFEAVRAVKRVVFLATPHQGSFRSGTWYSRFASSWIRLPGVVNRTVQNLLGSDEAARIRSLLGDRVPTSLYAMDPHSVFVEVLRETPIAPGVAYHSIIPVAGGGRLAEENDGVVTYESAHLAGVASEFIVQSPHSCQDNPLTIMEVRRILHEHIRSVRQ